MTVRGSMVRWLAALAAMASTLATEQSGATQHRTSLRSSLRRHAPDRSARAEIAWSSVRSPAPGTPEPFGSYTQGCLRGAIALEPEGEGYQVIRLSRRRYYAHPTMAAFVRELGHRVAQARLGVLLVGDISQPRGGPMLSGHSSHQIGLDVDLWLRLDLPVLPRSQREHVILPSMVDATTGRVDPTRWGTAQETLVYLAATDPRVARVFVHPAIKLALCQRSWPDRTWLRRVRPWFGHDEHIHVRLQCPAGAVHCVPQSPPPEGDGCGEELLEWLRPRARRPVRPTPTPPSERPLPPICREVLNAR